MPTCHVCGQEFPYGPQGIVAHSRHVDEHYGVNNQSEKDAMFQTGEPMDLAMRLLKNYDIEEVKRNLMNAGAFEDYIDHQIDNAQPGMDRNLPRPYGLMSHQALNHLMNGFYEGDIREMLDDPNFAFDRNKEGKLIWNARNLGAGEPEHAHPEHLGFMIENQLEGTPIDFQGIGKEVMLRWLENTPWKLNEPRTSKFLGLELKPTSTTDFSSTYAYGPTDTLEQVEGIKGRGFQDIMTGEPMDLAWRLLKMPVVDTDIPELRMAYDFDDEVSEARQSHPQGIIGNSPLISNRQDEISDMTPNQYFDLLNQFFIQEHGKRLPDKDADYRWANMRMGAETPKEHIGNMVQGIGEGQVMGMPSLYLENDGRGNFFPTGQQEGGHRMEALRQMGHGDTPVPVLQQKRGYNREPDNSIETLTEDPNSIFYGADHKHMSDLLQTGEPMDLAMRLLKMPIVSDLPEVRQLDTGPANIHQFQDPVTGEVKPLYISPASNPDSENLYAGIVGDNGDRASAKFNTGDGDYASLDGVETQEPYRRRGYMSAIYDAMDEYLQQNKTGRRLVPSDFQSDEGKAFWESRKKSEPMDIAMQLLKISADEIDDIEREIEGSVKDSRRTFPKGRKKTRSMGMGSSEEEWEPRERPNARQGRKPLSFEQQESEWDKLDMHPGSRGHEINALRSEQARGYPPEFGTFADLDDGDYLLQEYNPNIEENPYWGSFIYPGSETRYNVPNNDYWIKDDKILNFPQRTESLEEVPTFSQTPFNPMTDFTRSEPMDLAFRLLKGDILVVSETVAKKLCPAGKAAAKRKFKVYPSAYANGWAVQYCKGKFRGKKKK